MREKSQFEKDYELARLSFLLSFIPEPIQRIMLFVIAVGWLAFFKGYLAHTGMSVGELLEPLWKLPMMVLELLWMLLRLLFSF